MVRWTFAAALELANGKRRVAGEALLDAFLTQYPFLPPTERRSMFLASLRMLEPDRVTFPKGNEHWLRDAQPALPAWVTIIEEEKSLTASEISFARSHPWTPQMQFMANLNVLPDLDTALQLDCFFRSHANDAVSVPAKERSWEIFGEEKKLEGIARQAWFREGGLTLAKLGCFTVARQPVHLLSFGPRLRGAIVSENEAGYHSLCRATRAGVGFELVVYGAGDEVRKFVEFLTETALQQKWDCIHYIGDVDARGLSIAADLDRRLRGAGAPPLRPFLPGYEAMLQDAQVPATISTADAWLPPPLNIKAAAIIEKGNRIAQEMIGWNFLASLFALAPNSAAEGRRGS